MTIWETHHPTDAKLALVGNEDAKEQKVDARLAKLKHNKKPTRRGRTRGQHQGLPGYGEGHRSVAHPGLHRDRRRQDGDDDADPSRRSQPRRKRHAQWTRAQ